MTSSHGVQPSRRVVRYAIVWPGARRVNERVLDGFIGEVKITEPMSEESDESTALLACNGSQDGIEAHSASGRKATGRISNDPTGIGTPLANSIA